MGLKVTWTRKARGQAPPGAQDVSELVAELSRARQTAEQRNALLAQLPLDPQWQMAEFGPGFPLTSEPLDQPDAQGFVNPRITQYPVSVNLRLDTERRHVPWQTLKMAADQPVFRACIEIRKNRISTLDWCFRVSPSYAAKTAKLGGKSQYEVESELRRQFQPEIDRLTTWWQVPDRRNGIEFADWMSQVQEEQLVWDALAIYPQKTYGGSTLDLTVIDASTIKPLLDEQGGRPRPPHPAFQQILYGFPRGDFTADMVDLDGKLVVPSAFSSSQLIYRRRVVRTWTPYGFSPTEQALLDGTLWNERFRWMLSEYKEGAQPVQWLVNRGDSGWDARQLLQYERYLNDRYAGKTEERYRNPLLPEGIEPVTQPNQQERYKPDYDLFLIKLQAMHFGVMMTELGFTEPGGLGSSGYHEGQEDIQARRDLTTVRWLNDFVTGISRTHLGMPDALEFSFLGLDEEDEAAEDAVDGARLARGQMTLNELRAKTGWPTLQFAEADMPMLQTQRGVVFLDGAAEAAPPGVLVEPAELKTGPGSESGPQTDPSGQPKAKVQGSPAPARPVVQSGSAADAAKELAQLASRLAKDPQALETFEFRHLDPELVKAAVGAGGAPPKGRSPAGSRPTHSSPYTRPSS